jgi:hypothetical protein
MMDAKRIAVRCSFSIEKDWPGHRAVLSRRQCKNTTSHASGKCWHHRPYEAPAIRSKVSALTGEGE